MIRHYCVPVALAEIACTTPEVVEKKVQRLRKNRKPVRGVKVSEDEKVAKQLGVTWDFRDHCDLFLGYPTLAQWERAHAKLGVYLVRLKRHVIVYSKGKMLDSSTRGTWKPLTRKRRRVYQSWVVR